MITSTKSKYDIIEELEDLKSKAIVKAVDFEEWEKIANFLFTGIDKIIEEGK